MRKSCRAEAAASAGSRCGAELTLSSSPRSSLYPGSDVLARLLPTRPSAAAELSPDRWRQAPPPPTPNHEQELPGGRRARVGAETQPGPEENGEGAAGVEEWDPSRPLRALVPRRGGGSRAVSAVPEGEARPRPPSAPAGGAARPGPALPRCLEPLGEAPVVPVASPRCARGSGSAALLPSEPGLRRSEAIRHNGFC